jgi:hypothetical protein
MHIGTDTMNGFLASMLLLHLLQLRKVNREMSSYQIFRAALDYIGTYLHRIAISLKTFGC